MLALVHHPVDVGEDLGVAPVQGDVGEAKLAGRGREGGNGGPLRVRDELK